jgi:hypothetical protein
MANAILQTGLLKTATIQPVVKPSILHTGTGNRSVMRTINKGVSTLATGYTDISNLRVYSLLDKELILRPSATFDRNGVPSIDIKDETGIYGIDGNTTGYSENCPGTPERPCRTELDLYISVAQQYLSPDKSTLLSSSFFPPNQTDPTADPYAFNLFNAPIGVLAIYLVGVPTGTVLTPIQEQTLYPTSTGIASWFNGQVGYLNDDDLINDLRRLQIKYLRKQIAGNCQGMVYRSAYAMYSALQTALLVFNYYQAVRIYEILKSFLLTNQNCDGCG